MIRVSRIRAHGRRRFITETVVLPEAIFPGLADLPEIPDTFYDVFQKTYGVLVTHTEERVTATESDATASVDLGVAPGTPLIRIERTAFTLDDRPVEWRVSLCHLKGAYYRARTR